MIQHDEIYLQLRYCDNTLHNFIEEAWGGDNDDTVTCLLYVVIDGIGQLIQMRAFMLRNDEEICMACMYTHLDLVRKSIHRYMLIEKETGTALMKQGIAILSEVQKLLSDLCIQIKQTLKTTDCVRVPNTAYGMFDDDEYED